MQVLVKCVIFEGRTQKVDSSARSTRITHVREGQVLGAWRAVDGRIGYALLDVSSMAMVSTLLMEAFPDARHIDIDEVVSVNTVSAYPQTQAPDAGDTRQTGT